MELKAHAEAQGQSVNGFINAAIRKWRDPLSSPEEASTMRDWAGVVLLYTLPSEALALGTAQRAAEAAGEDLPQFAARAVDTQAKRDKSSLSLGIDPATGGKLEKEA